jgi:hypothetical protein
VTPPESPASLLERAAQHVLRLSAHFEDYVKGAEDDPSRVGTPMSWWCYDTLDKFAPTQAKRWAEAMNPLIGIPLANWFRETADRVKWAKNFSEVTASPAFEMAVLILGEPAPGEDTL